MTVARVPRPRASSHVAAPAVLLGLVMAAAAVLPARADHGAAANTVAASTETAGAAASGENTQAAPTAGGQSAQPTPTVPTLIADINLTLQTMTVRADGRQLYTWRISSGRDGYRTPVGTFRPEWMARMWYSREYDLAPMPHAVFFKSGAAVHGTSATGQLGTPASHGCVRLAPANAAIFYRLVRKHGLSATRIMVHGRPPPGRDRMAERERDGDQIGSHRTYDRHTYYGYPFRPGVASYSPAYQRVEPRTRHIPRPYDRVRLHWR